MRYCIVFLSLLLLLCGRLKGQTIITGVVTDSLNNPMGMDESDTALVLAQIEEYLLFQQKNRCSDEVFVHTDRNMYAPGDTIYFQAYIRDRFTNLFESKSVALYAILFNDKQMVVDSARFRIDKFTSSGWLAIPSIAETGKYRFIAFSGKMQNFDPEDAFRLDLTVKPKGYKIVKSGVEFERNIYQPGDTIANQPGLQTVINSETKNIPVIENINIPFENQYFELRFLPEGGTLVEGLEQRIGFNATDFRGDPVYIEGMLKDSAGSILDTIKSGTFGPGQFVCTPQPGMFVELIKGSGSKTTWPLPDPVKTGITMSVKPVNERSFAVEIQSTGYSGDTVTVSGIMNPTNIFSEELKLNKKQRIVVETDQLLSGVAQITLFNKELRPLAERFYYINADKQLKFDIKTESHIHHPGQEIRPGLTRGAVNKSSHHKH